MSPEVEAGAHVYTSFVMYRILRDVTDNYDCHTPITSMMTRYTTEPGCTIVVVSYF